jgi:hypothetical protein
MYAFWTRTCMTSVGLGLSHDQTLLSDPPGSVWKTYIRSNCRTMSILCTVSCITAVLVCVYSLSLYYNAIAFTALFNVFLSNVKLVDKLLIIYKKTLYYRYLHYHQYVQYEVTGNKNRCPWKIHSYHATIVLSVNECLFLP